MGQTIFEKGKEVTVEGRKTHLTIRKLLQDKFCPEVDGALSRGKPCAWKRSALWLHPAFFKQSVQIL